MARRPGGEPSGEDGRRARRSAARFRARPGARARAEAESERARDGRARSLGEPALFAIALSAVGSSIYFVLGVVADDALGLTPLVFFLSGLFFVVSMLTYVEGTSLHPERGGASTFARYAFNELWSFVAGWAIILDYLIVMAFGAFAVSHYLARSGATPATRACSRSSIAGAAALRSRRSNIRGLSANRLGTVLRLSLFSIAVLVGVSVIGFAQYWDPGAISSSIHVGSAPTWQNLIFAAVVASVAAIGVEAASGLAGEIRVGTPRAAARGARLDRGRDAAVPVRVGRRPDGGTRGGRPHSTRRPLRRGPGAGDRVRLRARAGCERRSATWCGVAALVLVKAVNGQVLGVARLAYSLATNRQIPSLVGRLHEALRHPLRGDRDHRGARLRPHDPDRRGLPGRPVRLRRDDRLRARPPLGDRAALPRARPPERLPGAALDPGRQRLDPDPGRRGRPAGDARSGSAS